MNVLTSLLRIAGTGATAYITARNIRDPQTRPNLLAGFQLAESGAVPFLETLSQRAASEGDDWLAERLARHAQDERRHGQVFAHALKQLNKHVIDVKSQQQRSEKSENKNRRSPFFDAYFKGFSKEELNPQHINWTVFFGSTYILELDACNDFTRMAHALPTDDPKCVSLQKGLLSVAHDEKGHAAYLREAMNRYLSPLQAMTLIDEWHSRKVDAMLAMVRGLMERQGQMPSLAQDGVPSELSDDEVKPSLATAAGDRQ